MWNSSNFEWNRCNIGFGGIIIFSQVIVVVVVAAVDLVVVVVVVAAVVVLVAVIFFFFLLVSPSFPISSVPSYPEEPRIIVMDVVVVICIYK